MLAYVANLLACPECEHFPLTLSVLETGEPRWAPTAVPPCDRWCGLENRAVSADRPPCRKCFETDVETGVVACSSCGRFYFVLDSVPRLLSEAFSDVLDVGVLRARFASIGDMPGLADYLARLDPERPSEAAAVRWSVEDVAYWDREYGDEEVTRVVLDRIARSRPDAGNRTYPRERMIFSRLRPRLGGKVLLDVGCGYAQTIRVLADPAKVDYCYIGADLARSALVANRKTMAGEFLQCSAERLPLRPGSVDATVMFGTLHHLSDQRAALRRTVAAVKPGGTLALHEVAYRTRLTQRMSVAAPLADDESAHNESIDVDATLAYLRSQTDALALRWEYSPPRAALVRWLDSAMRTRPWLTRLVLAVDALAIHTLGRVWPFLGARELLVVARRRDVAPVEPVLRQELASTSS